MTRKTESRHARRVAPDTLLALAVFLTLGGIYVGTLLPGLGGTEDTAKFQYVGPALGTPHDPGYPLYMIASWAASKLPIGTVAYRINLLSAFWGSTAAAFLFLAMRRLAVPQALAVAVALGMGLGSAFWEHSTYAEVYTQASALTAAALVALLAWSERRRDRDLYAAVAATSFAFGTHLIIVGAVPVFAWFVLTRYHWRLPPRVIAVSGLLVALGLAQYSYVWIRTVQGAQYLEAHASSPAELVDTLRAAQFEDQTFKDPPLAVARSRIPGIARAVGTELGALATPMAVLGVLAEWRRRRSSVILLTGAFLGPALLLSMLGQVATNGILLPALVPLWTLVGAGAAWLWSLVGSLALPRGVRVAAFAGIALLAAAIPATQAHANFASNNRRADIFNTDYFNDLFHRIIGPTAFLEENDYVTHHMLEYQRYVTRMRDVAVGIPRDPELVTTLLRDGVTVYGFNQAVAALDGRVSVRAVTLSGSSLNGRLAGLPDGILVVVAGVAHRWPPLDAIGAGDRVGQRGGGVVVALKGFGPVLVTPSDFQGAIDITRGQRLGQSGVTSAMSLHVEVRGLNTTIDVDGQRVVESTGGLAVAEMGSRLWATYVVDSGDGFRPPLDMSRRPLFQVTGVRDTVACTSIGDGQWRPLSDPGSAGRLLGRIDNFRAFDANWVVYLTSDHALRARLGNWFGPSEPAFVAEAFVPAQDGERLRARLTEDGLEAPSELLSAPVVTRLGVKVNDQGDWSTFRLALGGRPKAGWGRAVTDQNYLQRGTSCALAAELLEPDVRTQRAALYLGPGADWLFGVGWQSAGPMPVGFHRVLRGAVGRLLLPVPEPAPITLRMSVEPIGGDTVVAVSLNGRKLIEALPLPATGWYELSWRVDTAAWRPGVNDLELQVTRPLGQAPAAEEPSLRVRAIELDWSRR
ncbi:MAG: DUF2723 domain-containing protein [Vicinamibacterales bacterium]